MNSVERTFCAISHRQPDQVPRGEFWLDKALLQKMYPGESKISFSHEVQAMKSLGIDTRAICPQASGLVTKKQNQPAITELDQAAGYVFPNPKAMDYSKISLWRRETDFFIFALLDGVFQGVASLMDFNTFLMATASSGSKLAKLIAGQCNYLIGQAKLAVAAGAHAILIGDDMAYKMGPYISPSSLRSLFFPGLKDVVAAIKQLGVPVFLHSDGNLNIILEDIIAMGFDGLHALESGAGMDLLAIKKRFGQDICLMGNLDVGFLAEAKPAEIKNVARELVQHAGVEGGFILGSSAGILDENIPLENLLALKEIM